MLHWVNGRDPAEKHQYGSRRWCGAALHGLFSCREKKILTLERVETGYTFKSPGLPFSPFIGKLFSFFFFIFFLTLDSLPPPSWFNVVNNEALRVPLVGKFFQGGVFLDQPRGHGSRGSAGAGREAVPLCQRGRAARNRRHRPLALEVRCHTSCEPPWQWQSRPDGKESSWLLPNQTP